MPLPRACDIGYQTVAEEGRYPGLQFHLGLVGPPQHVVHVQNCGDAQLAEDAQARGRVPVFVNTASNEALPTMASTRSGVNSMREMT